jgi:hypothetical protein
MWHNYVVKNFNAKSGILKKLALFYPKYLLFWGFKGYKK